MCTGEDFRDTVRAESANGVLKVFLTRFKDIPTSFVCEKFMRCFHFIMAASLAFTFS